MSQKTEMYASLFLFHSPMKNTLILKSLHADIAISAISAKGQVKFNICLGYATTH